MSQPSKTALIMAGGTGGHIFPGLAVAEALRARGWNVHWLGAPNSMEADKVPARGFAFEPVEFSGVRGKGLSTLLKLPMRLSRAVEQSKDVIRRVNPDVVIGFGGYVALPAYLAARGGLTGRHRVPVVIHEANASAGIANKVGARSAERVLAAVPDSGLENAEVVGVPVRATITGLDRAALRAQARAHFGFAEDALVLLVFGGSQGAASINRAVSAAAGDLAARRIAVLHAHGPKNTLELPVASPGDPPYVPVPYLDRMDLAYAAADLAICRSGAMTVAEVSAVGLPAVYVPLPIGNGEQRLNALPVVDAGGGLLVDDAELTPDYVTERIGTLMGDTAALDQMTTAAALAGHRDAARRVAQIALEVAGVATGSGLR